MTLNSKHDPIDCPYCCVDSTTDIPHFGLDSRVVEFQVHVLAKLAELESRVQDMEWRSMPLGPKPESHEPDPAVVAHLIDELKKGC